MAINHIIINHIKKYLNNNLSFNMMDDIKKDIEVIEEECEKVKCEPIFNIINAIFKLFSDLLKCFKHD